MSQTPIEWTDETWNPTRGCSPVSPGCKNCYAERIAARFSGTYVTINGHEAPLDPVGKFAGFAKQTKDGPKWTGKVELIESKLLEPLHWRKPRRVFVNSMSDLFHENLPTREIMRVFAVMALTPWITYQVLTKRAPRLPLVIDSQFEHDVKGCAWEILGHYGKFNHQYMGSNVISRPWPLPNVWLGVSVENQPTADERILELLRTPAALRFVSYEPALADIYWGTWLHRGEHSPGLDWGIIGGESGPGARPFDLKWARTTIRQFEAAGVPLFVKQLGTRPIQSDGGLPTQYPLIDKKGGNWDEWPADLRVREFPTVASHFAK